MVLNSSCMSKSTEELLQNSPLGNSLEVQWLGLGALTAVAQVQSLVGELRSCKPHGVAKKNPKTKTVLFPGSLIKLEFGGMRPKH